MNISSIISIAEWLLPVLLVFAVILTLSSWVASRPRGRQFTPLANVAEGTWHDSINCIADNAVTARWLLAKQGNSETDADICGAADVPFGVFVDECAQGDSIAVEFLGKGRTKLGIADVAITYGQLLVPAAGGEVKPLPEDPGTYWVIGRALRSQATIGDLVPYADCVPYQVTVSS